MLRDNLVGLIEPMRISAGVDPLALIQKQSSDDRSSCLENPRPEGAESSLTENVTSPFQAEPAHHEMGHFSGLDHSQINLDLLQSGLIGNCPIDELAGLPLMFPVEFC